MEWNKRVLIGRGDVMIISSCDAQLQMNLFIYIFILTFLILSLVMLPHPFHNY